MDFADFSKWPDWLRRLWENDTVRHPTLILIMAEKQIGAVSMARDRASCGEWPDPISPAEFLAWIEDEEEIQRDNAASSPAEAAEILPYAELLGHYAGLLRACDVEPAPIFGYEYIRNHLVHTLIALAKRVESGEDYGPIFDGTNLFMELLTRVRALSKTKNADDEAALKSAEELLGALRDLVFFINVDKDGNYFICEEGREDVEAAQVLLCERLGKDWATDLHHVLPPSNEDIEIGAQV
jgi:hypothetical protein